MRMVRRETLYGAALCMAVWSCGSDTLIGEIHCYGDEVDCASDAPTLGPIGDGVVPGSTYDVVASRTVAPTWVNEFSAGSYPQVVSAPDGGTWALFWTTQGSTLQRIDADGELVGSYAVSGYGNLFVDEERNALVLAPSIMRDTASVSSFAVDAQGEVSEHKIDIAHPPAGAYVAPGPAGHVRVGSFAAQGSYVAEYGLAGDLLWKQTGVRDARDFPFEDLEAGLTPNVSYDLLTLSDGALAVGVPKYIDNVPGFTVGRTQGVTLLEADGNVRWDFWLGSKPSVTLRMTAGRDGSVVVTHASPYGDDGSAWTMVLGRDGEVLARWQGGRVGYHSAIAQALCADAAGDIYIAMLSGERDAPLPTVCRMRSSDPSAEVVCLAVDVPPLDTEGDPSELLPAYTGAAINSMTAPEPGAVVFAFAKFGDRSIRLVRIDF
jgi:hypothetical protein